MANIARDTDAQEAWRKRAAVSARRRQLETDLRAEGFWPEATIALLATDDVAAKMIEQERRTIAAFANMFSGSAP